LSFGRYRLKDLERQPSTDPALWRPRAIRVAHWLNTVVLAVMLWSGFSMFVTERAYAPFVHRVPDALWAALLLSGHRSGGRAWHYAFAIIFAANGICYAVAAVRRSAWYAGAQKYAYAAAIAFAAFMVVTGASMWFHPQLLWLQSGMGGKRVVENVHIGIACFLILFTAVHIVQVLRAGAPTFFRMLVGREELTPWSAGRTVAAIVAVGLALVAGLDTSKPTGVPAYLQWLVPADDKHNVHRHVIHPKRPPSAAFDHLCCTASGATRGVAGRSAIVLRDGARVVR
jgi:thiosulfate reductase cytochrome b subunit